jgi:excisionase family DNA binding protein
MANDTQHERPVMTVLEAAKMLRVDHKTLRKEIASGRVPHVRFGRVIRIPRQAIVDMAEGRPVKPLGGGQRDAG